MSEIKLDSPSFHRNIDPISDLLDKLFADDSLYVLEVGSGSGQHVSRFGPRFPKCSFQPTEIDADNLQSIDNWVKAAGASNVRPAIILEVTSHPWPLAETERFDMFTAFNVIHITPWSVTENLFKGAGICSNENARVLLYGPFKINGKHTSESNIQFDQWLKEKNPSFGVRDIDDVEDVAKVAGFRLSKRHAMPANNFMMEFVKTG